MSSSSFKNIIVHKIDPATGEETSEESNVNDLLMTEENQFSGWECWAGIQNITIDNEGNVWRAICRQGNKLGSIYSDFEIPLDTVLCQKKSCNCAADIQLTKYHPDHKKRVRLGKEEDE